MRIEIGKEARGGRTLPPLALGQTMEIHVDIDELAERLADALQEHEERLLSELVTRFVEEIGATFRHRAAVRMNGDSKIMGIKPHALYPVSFVADRWDVSEDNVRKKSPEELPRADWHGGEIRYRGVDILRYEGVGVEDYLDKSSFLLEGRRASQSAEVQESNGRVSSPAEENGNRRPYNSDLPDLSDEDGSPD